jgi:hypothetical protein
MQFFQDNITGTVEGCRFLKPDDIQKVNEFLKRKNR